LGLIYSTNNKQGEVPALHANENRR